MLTQLDALGAALEKGGAGDAASAKAAVSGVKGKTR
jgi:hypothetical protein